MQPRLWLVFSVKLAALWSSSALLQTPRSLTVLTNQIAKVSCEAKTLPKTTVISWLRQRRGPTMDKHFEFLASWNPSKAAATYGEGVKKENIIMFSDITRYVLNLTSVKLEDSGTYFCMMIGSPQLIFGTGTELRVVDVLPTPAQTTKKTILKKKQCPVPNPKAQKGLTCGLITLSLLVASLLVLLVSLSVAVHLHCLRRKARIRFMKQFHK
ncbi:T-cell surface glycoprotein CD8 beta chain [Mesocricetus auratus]|uniref:T-cell surface glycoprotein CD8 beta chain n=1 Tax=Mesocricetus auratus TaxID=10036 RepID=A0ABM2WWC9_MESAU|nr:T-cell surface glycoprotein CD8 beta chain [Mesocricetus auratus]